MLNCPLCKKTVLIEKGRFYSCPNCTFSIGKAILKKAITPEIIGELCDNGRTKILKGFISKNGKPFDAALVIKGNKVTFEFPGQLEENIQNKTTKVRVYSSSPGIVNINITGPTQYSAMVDFGLVSSRMAECLGVISAAKYLKYHGITGKIQISANNKEFVEYALREITPRKKEMQYAIKYMWQTLEPFEWDISLERRQKTRLYGGTTNKTFPKNLFPWAEIKRTIIGNEIYIDLTDCPAIQAQISASIKSAKRIEKNIIIPIAARNVLDAWEKTVIG